MRPPIIIVSEDTFSPKMYCSVFHNIISFLYVIGLDMLSLLPDLKSLLASPQLQEKGLSDDPSFRLLMKAGYEQVARVQSRIATYASTGQQVTVEAMT